MAIKRIERRGSCVAHDEAGNEHVKQNFLLTRHLRDYLMHFLSTQKPGKDMVRLPVQDAAVVGR